MNFRREVRRDEYTIVFEAGLDWVNTNTDEFDPVQFADVFQTKILATGKWRWSGRARY
ncbi:MAG: hypothetical protein R3B54_07775 [Bdellovibrionota bacterium]